MKKSPALTAQRKREFEQESRYLLQLGNSPLNFTIVMHSGDGRQACYISLSALDELIQDLKKAAEYHDSRVRETGQPFKTVHFLNTGNTYHKPS